MPTTFEEKRIDKRYEGVYVEYSFITMNDDYRYVDVKNCFLRNFSMGGACLYVYESVPPESHIYVRLYDPNDSIPIDIMGRIVWHSRAGIAGGPNARLQNNVGIQFLEMNDKSRRRLKVVIDHLESLMPKKKSGIDYR